MSTTIIAIIGGIASGGIVHFISRAFGLETTLPGSLWGCAVATAILCRVRWRLD